MHHEHLSSGQSQTTVLEGRSLFEPLNLGVGFVDIGFSNRVDAAVQFAPRQRTQNSHYGCWQRARLQRIRPAHLHENRSRASFLRQRPSTVRRLSELSEKQRQQR